MFYTGLYWENIEKKSSCLKRHGLDRGVKLFFTHSPCRTSGWKKLLALMALSLALND